MERRLNKVPPIDILDGIINIYVNYSVANIVSAFTLMPLTRNITNNVITPSIEFDCNNVQMLRYRQVCAKSPACDNAIAYQTEAADTICGVCYRYNNPDNPVYEVNTRAIPEGVKTIAPEFASRALVYMLRNMKLHHITYNEDFRALVMALYVLGDMIGEWLANHLESAIKINDLRDAVTDVSIKRRLMDGLTSVMFKNQIYEIVAEVISHSELIVAQLNSINMLYSNLYLKFRTDNQASEPHIVSSIDEVPWTIRDHMYGKQLANDYWDNFDVNRLIATTNLDYPAGELAVIASAASTTRISAITGVLSRLVRVIIIFILLKNMFRSASISVDTAGLKHINFTESPNVAGVIGIVAICYYLLKN